MKTRCRAGDGAEIDVMKNFLRAGFLVSLTAVAHAAEGGFTRGLSPDDFRAAGLGKLTAQEIALLDALVERHRGGPQAGRVEAGAVLPGEAPPAVKSREVPAPKADRDAKVVVAPGTRIEFAAVESRLTGAFTGWEPRGVFALENGQRWREANGTTYASPPLSAPKVRITPGALGTFWMEIEGVRVRVKVVRIDSGR
jgi:hypothetical protein